MNGPQREEIDAKLSLVEARMDSRIAALFARMDAFMERMDERDKRYEARFVTIEGICAEIKADIGNLRTTTIITAITATLATVFGVAAFNATVLNNMLASFESGKNTSSAQAEIKRQQLEIDWRMKEIDKGMADIDKKAAKTEQLLDQLDARIKALPARKAVP